MAPQDMTDATPPTPSRLRNLFEVFTTALKLGLMSFGGPIAHIGYFRDEYVGRKKWLSEREFADLVALAQVLPGPASSQVGMAVGQLRGGIPGALIAWSGFTMPSPSR
jgi:chromate transporter